MGVISVIFYKASIDLNFLYFAMATLTCSGVPPLVASVTWSKTPGWGACTGACFSLLSSAFLVIVFSLIWPQNYDWKDMKHQSFDDIQKQRLEIESEETPAALDHAQKQIWWWSGVLCFVLVIAWPLLALPAGVFSKGYFTFWVALSLMWSLIALVAAAALPLLESGPVIASTFGLFLPCLRPFFERLAKKAERISVASADPVKAPVSISEEWRQSKDISKGEVIPHDSAEDITTDHNKNVAAYKA
ncbi:hypothetical protein WJX73_001283 [Symbiochloris irregularis]|uniref:Uncharacterized protein n=1 Tax=Symbiochloris irregularis TaxID=706552 RepID=A0AAW1PUL3_9CHLO